MRFVVDSNVLFTFFWKDSFSKGILVDQDFDFFAPELALEEIKRNSEHILKKTGILKEKFKELLNDIAIFVEFVPVEEYKEFLHKADCISDKNDIDFIALGLKLNCPVWSNDPHLKEQSLVKVFGTDEFIKMFLSD